MYLKVYLQIKLYKIIHFLIDHLSIKNPFIRNIYINLEFKREIFYQNIGCFSNNNPISF
jgi:hypothetical protein